MSEYQNHTCPLCKSSQTNEFESAQKRDFFQCSKCDLVFVPSKQLPNEDLEKSCYDHHHNDPHDKGYRNFLNQLAKPLLRHLPAQSHGLDFGSGPGPTLSLMLEEAGHKVDLYDIFYAPNDSVFTCHYDFISSTEVFEHLHDPKAVIEKLLPCLKQGGLLAIMTQFCKTQNEFADWHYIRDITHVRFFSKKTFTWIADAFNLEILELKHPIAIFRKL